VRGGAESREAREEHEPEDSDQGHEDLLPGAVELHSLRDPEAGTLAVKARNASGEVSVFCAYPPLDRLVCGIARSYTETRAPRLAQWASATASRASPGARKTVTVSRSGTPRLPVSEGTGSPAGSGSWAAPAPPRTPLPARRSAPDVARCLLDPPHGSAQRAPGRGAPGPRRGPVPGRAAGPGSRVPEARRARPALPSPRARRRECRGERLGRGEWTARRPLRNPAAIPRAGEDPCADTVAARRTLAIHPPPPSPRRSSQGQRCSSRAPRGAWDS